MIKLEKDGLMLEISSPGETYRGTRFDWNAAFHRIEYKGRSFADKWYDTREDPLKHDNLRGPSEEFKGILPVREGWLKIGVGILAREGDSGQYDMFHTYPILRSGVRSQKAGKSSAVFRDILEGYYGLEKTVRIGAAGEFILTHALQNLGEEVLPIMNYNHNFFTFGLPAVGKGRRIILPRPFFGNWREDSVGAAQEGLSIVMTSALAENEKSCMTDIVVPGAATPEEGYSFILEGENGLRVEASCDAPLHHAQFWSNYKVSCWEPFVAQDLQPGGTFRWNIRYRLSF